SRHLEHKMGANIAEAWELALDKNKAHLAMLDEDYEVISGFGSQLGMADKESQKQLFKIAQLQLKRQEEKAQEERNRYEKMYRSLGFLTGLAIIIILF